MKKIGAVALVLVLVAMTMGCGFLFGGLDGTWKGEYTESDSGFEVTVKVTLELDEPSFKMTYQFEVPEELKEYGVTSEQLTEKFEGTYTYDKKNKLITLISDDGGREYGHVDGKEMDFGGLILKKQ